MATTITFNGTSYSIPATGERAWGSAVSSYLVAIASGTLQKTGGSFTLTAADVDFGATYGIKAAKFSSRSTPSTTGLVRLGNNESIGWRNAGNSADLLFKVNASNVLEFNGNPLLTLALGAAYTALKMNAGGTAYEWGLLTNDNIDGSAAIAWSKISKSGSNLTDLATRSHTALSDIGTNTHAQIDTAISTFTSHIANTSNPHSVDANDVGLGNVDNTSDNTKNAAVATLTNKTIVSPVIDEYMDINEEAAPGTPASGKVRVYAKTDKKLYKKDSSGVEQEVGAGSGTGLATFFSDDFENGSAANWTSYDDGASATPVDGTGGSPSTLTVTASSSSPLRGTYSLSVAKSAANGQGEGIAASVTVPSGYQQAAKRVIEFLWDGSDASYAAGDMVCYIYDVTNATLITPETTSLPAAKMPMQIAWDSTTSGSYRLIFHVATTNASAYTVKIDDVKVAPGTIINAPAAGPYSLTLTTNGFGVITNEKVDAERTASGYLSVKGFFRAGTVAASTASFDLPSGLTIDHSRLTSTTNGQDIGRYTRIISGAATDIFGSSPLAGVLYVLSTDNNTIFFAKQTGSNVYTSINGNSVCNSNDYISVNFEIPIAEWAGAPNYAGNNDVVYVSTTGTWDADDTTVASLSYSSAGTQTGGALTASRTKRVRGPAGWVPVVQLQTQTGGGWVNASDILPRNRENTAESGVTIGSVASSTTDYDVIFRQYQILNGGTFGAAGVAWTTAYYWRVAFVRPGAAVGFGAAAQDRLGLVKAGQVPGTNTNDSAVTGNVGEFVSANPGGTVAPASSGSYKTITSISLTAGDWDVSGVAVLTQGTISGMGLYFAGISLTTDNFDSLSQGGFASGNPVSSGSNYLATGTRRISVSATTTVYLVGLVSYTSVGTAVYATNSRIQARRAR